MANDNHARDSERRSPPTRLHVLVKPTGAICNLDCTYCFYLDKEKLYPDSKFRMSDEVLERYIRQLIESQPLGRVVVAFQGGEPTLMGIDFFRRAIEYERRYARPGMVFENTVQTNGTLLDDALCAFFHEHQFLIGISIDGPRELHDVYRVDKGGKPTFDKVMRGIRLLQKHRVEHNLLCTVNRTNAEHPLEVYRFLRDEVGTPYVQFIPVVERVLGDVVSESSVRPAQFGTFLRTIFDEWVSKDVGKVYVQTFEAAARNFFGMPSSGLCVFDKTCGHGLALEHNGDVYSCDHFVDVDHRLGNIGEQHLQALADSEPQLRFGLDKLEGLPRACRECDVLFACHGECPKNRFTRTPDGEPGLNYLCEGYKGFFRHVDGPLKRMKAVMSQGQPAAAVMPLLRREAAGQSAREALRRSGRNQVCPCGSGRKYKHCHGGASADG
jgi:uncharacterized protein